MSEKKENFNLPFSDLDFYNDNHGNEFIKELEMRYSLENEMIKAVSHGNYKALSKVVTAQTFIKSVEKRVEDPIRNIKNYMIILNTLMRKGAEVGNVHPFYIHSVSSEFAKRIESFKTESEAEKLWDEMMYSYCKLVKTHASKGYSPLVRNVVMLIDADLSAELTLNAMAQKFNVNASYLSSLFKKDTGETLTQYVNRKRIEKAMFLIESTSQQIQDIAHSCGIFDVNYFSKIFKKHTDKTPKQYREFFINNGDIDSKS